MAAAPRLVLVDGSAMFFRAYYAMPGNLRSSAGLPTNAVFGFATMFRKLFAGKTPERGAVVFDAPGPTFRDERYPDYKANRETPPDDLSVQRPWVDRLVEAHGFPILRVPGYEADDVIGTLATKAAKKGFEVVIVSADKDFVQLLGPSVRMFDPFPGAGGAAGLMYDVERAVKKWGVQPEKFVDLLALTGDKIDNIPGVPGIGKKGAAELLETYGDLEGILAHVHELKGRQKSALEAHAEDARISRELATIDRRVPLPVQLDDLELPPLDEAALNALYTELEFYSLLTEAQVSAAEEKAATEDTEVLDPADVGAWLEAAEGVVALEPIFDGNPAAPGALVGLALAREAGRAVYLDLRAGLPSGLARWLEDPARAKVAHAAKLTRLLLLGGAVEARGFEGDTQLASFLVDPVKLIPHRLDQISKEYLQRPLPPEKRVRGSGKSEKTFRALDPEAVGPWAGRRAVAVFEAWPKLAEALEAEGQMGQLRDVDLPLSALLARVEKTGILVSSSELEAIEGEFEGRLAELEGEIHGLAGKVFNIGSTKQLAEVLFEDLGLPVVKRTKTGYSTNAEVLERLAPKHPIAEKLLEHRKLAKLINTYTRVLQDAILPSTGRVHATFQQTVGVTGRLISTDPDLQRTPIKTPEGERIRQAFVVPEGMKMVSADWSQIELRLLAHVSEDPLLLESFRDGLDVHTRTASQLFGVELDEVTRDQRRIGKTVNFATVYGQGATALGQILGIPRKEAQSYIDEYFRAYAGVRRWLDATIEKARETGYVETLNGRRRYIPELSSNAFMERSAGERIAANTPIQGSAADICKAAMLAIDAEMRSRPLASRMVCQIHDELLFECPEAEVDAVGELAKRHMESVVKLRVPLVTEVGVGRTWAEAH
jgi:DNA polymerase-1